MYEWGRLYGFAGLNTSAIHCLLNACIIHLLHVPTLRATENLKYAVEIYQSIASRRGWAETSLQLLRGLVKTWDIVLGPEIKNILYCGPGSTSTSSQLQTHLLDPLRTLV